MTGMGTLRGFLSEVTKFYCLALVVPDLQQLRNCCGVSYVHIILRLVLFFALKFPPKYNKMWQQIKKMACMFSSKPKAISQKVHRPPMSLSQASRIGLKLPQQSHVIANTKIIYRESSIFRNISHSKFQNFSINFKLKYQECALIRN